MKIQFRDFFNIEHKFGKATVYTFLVMSIIGGILFGYVTSEIRNFSGIENLKRFQPNLPTKLIDVDGELIAELFQEKRDIVAFEDLPKSLINAFIATEDGDFYNHFGVNPAAIIRAFFKNLFAGHVVQGGSTITQQLAKRLFTKSEKTIVRKVLEAILALQIEKKFSKEEILEMYFNQIYLGHGCYGVASAANLFFNKEVRHLNLAECSVLAALPSAPTTYSPLMSPHAAYEKNRDILNRMVNSGYLTQERADKIYMEFWPQFIDSIKTEFPTRTASTRNIDNAPYFTDYIRQNLLARFGKDVVYNEGLTIFTTLSLKRQKVAQKYLSEGLVLQNETSALVNKYTSGAVDRSLFNIYDSMRNIFDLPEAKVKDDIETHFNKIMMDEIVEAADMISLFVNADLCHEAIEAYRANSYDIASTLKVEGAFVALEPKTGYITTMIGGSGFSVDNQYNRAVQARRQVGSAFKPFVYGAALDSGLINAATALPDAPIVNIAEDGETWTPGNYKDSFSGFVRLRRALARSINIISIRIFDIVGPEKIIDYATNILRVPESRFTMTPSLALGVCEMTPLEMARAYGVYANRGRDVIPFGIRSVIDRDGIELLNMEQEVGNIMAEKEMNGTIQVISEDLAYVMTSLMQSVVNNGTATEAIRVGAGFSKPCAGKTGTTSNWTDAWFCGYTPDIVAIVWEGYDRPFMSLGKHQAGANVAAPVWGNYMRDIYNGMKDPEFPSIPPGVYGVGVCDYTGLLPSPSCNTVDSELMIKGKDYPKEVCGGNHFQVKSLLDRYMEKEGVEIKE